MNFDDRDEIEQNKERRSRKRPDSRPLGNREQSGELNSMNEPERHSYTHTSVPSSMRAIQAKERKKKRRIIGMIIAECFALLFIFAYAHFAKIWNTMPTLDFAREKVENKELDIDTVKTMKGYWTIAIFGVDDRGKILGAGTNADVNIICNINQDTGEIKLVSVFRDSYLNINDKNLKDSRNYNKINQAYFLGGPEQAVSALNRNLDLQITDYVTFNWKAVADAINILGGIDLEISKAEFYYINSFITETVKATGIASQHLKSAGMNHLDGVQAVAYGRLRLMDTDFARTERQRKVVAKAFEKAKKADIAQLNNIVETLFPQVVTSIGLQDIANSVFSISKYHLGETAGFPSARGDANMGENGKKGACVIPQTLESNVILLHQFLFGSESYQPTETLKTIGAKISSDSGMYNAGKAIEHVPTDGGYIPKATKPATETSAPKRTESREDEESSEESTKEDDGSESSKATTSPSLRPGQTTESETDSNGNPIRPTHGGNQRPSESVKPNPTLPSQSRPIISPTKPEPTKPPEDTTGPGVLPTEPVTSATNPVEPEIPTVVPIPGSTQESSVSYNGPGAASSAENPNSPAAGPTSSPNAEPGPS